MPRRRLALLALAVALAACGDSLAPEGEARPELSVASAGPGGDETAGLTVLPELVAVPWDLEVEFPLVRGASAGAGPSVTFLGQPSHGKATLRGRSLRYLGLSRTATEDSLRITLTQGGRTDTATVRFAFLGPTPADTAVCALAGRLNEAPVETPYLAGDITDPSLGELRVLAEQVLRDYGSPRSDVEQARALRDWVARTALHPDSAFHPTGSAINTQVLPDGATWGDFNAAVARRVSADNAFWFQRHYDAVAMLRELLGTYDAGTGRRADDGMLRHIGGAQYQVRSLDTFRTLLCSYQGVILRGLLLSIGLHGAIVQLGDHDALAVFLPSLGKWVYMDPTFNESFLDPRTGELQSPEEIHRARLSGTHGSLVPDVPPVPVWDAVPFATRVGDARASYFGNNPAGFVILGTLLNNRDAGQRDRWGGILGMAPAIAPSPYNDQVYPFSRRDRYPVLQYDELFPYFGAVATTTRVGADSVWLTAASTLPQTQQLEYRVGQGAWSPLPGSLLLDLRSFPSGSSIDVRPRDVRGHPGGGTRLGLRNEGCASTVPSMPLLVQ